MVGRGAFHEPMKVAREGSWRKWKRECRYKYTKKTGEIPVRRKPKVSWVKVICPGLVGP